MPHGILALPLREHRDILRIAYIGRKHVWPSARVQRPSGLVLPHRPSGTRGRHREDWKRPIH
jgi:hypothetical protein